MDADGSCVMLLQFADDALIFLPNLEDEVGNLRGILTMFESILGMNVNLAKSKLMLIGLVPNLDRLASVLGCAVSSIPGIYLGLPLRGHLKSKHIWDPMMERVKQRLARWKG